MNGKPTAAAAGKIDVGGDVSVNPGHVEESVAAASVLVRDGAAVPGVVCDGSRW
jgi:hypothetical protein